MTTQKKNNIEQYKIDLDHNITNGIDVKNRTIRISGHIGISNTDEYFDFNLLDVGLSEMESKNSEPVKIKINSIGGTVYEALAIVGRLKQSPCEIHTYGYGAVMSAATLILMSGDHRHISKYAVSMFHSAQYGVGGDHEIIKEQVKQAEKEEKLWAQYCEEFSNKTSSWWLRKIKKTEYYPTSEEMLSIGAVDEIF